ncbi:small nuclear RNA activating complex, polypeptide 3 [Phytophthora boehmeriae]|uniref:Small nuclear RNA activating complex, polypeptide 3 n=1 Tax=Phytophthora boehmeriae TaxID=109152 RepID=A0A8T1WMH6_9STRA|nr:small nuclear RNA activating complex, polypeptide 3 [Phytophthora boehmeriae]
MDFAALFPPLVSDADCKEDFSSVDISVDDLSLPPLEKAVDAGIYRALRRWNEGDPAHVDAALPYLERVKKYQRIANIMLHPDVELATAELQEEEQENEAEGAPEEEPEAVADRAAQVAKARAKVAALKRKDKEIKKRQRQQKSEQTQYRAVVDELADIEELREQRQPSERLQQFVAKFVPKKRRLVQKRSMADTVTAMSFEFARPLPDPEAAQGEMEEEVKSSATGRTIQDIDPILWFDVLHPSKDPARTQSFLVRRSQRLSELVDLIACANDERLHQHDKPSKLVYFGQKFFVDRRIPGCLDYSEQILQWIRAKPEREAKYGTFIVGERVTRSLHSTTFASLELQVDIPGVYIHQGECEHLLRLRDARMPHEYDAPTSDGIFPLRLPNLHNRQLRNCLVCQHYSAKFVCYGDRLALMDPMFFCERCYRAAHYDAEGNLLYDDFLSFPFIQE